MRIAFYAPSAASIDVGGVETFVREVTIRIMERGNEVSILSGLSALSKDSKELARSGARFKLFPFARRYTSLNSTLVSFLRNFKLTPYAVESFSIFPFGLSHLLTHKYEIVVVTSITDCLAKIAIKRPIVLHFQGGSIVDWQIGLLRKFPPECIIACSKFAATQFRLYRIPWPIYSIPNGVDLKRFHPDHMIRQRMRNQLKVTDKDVILFIGRFVEEKGIEYLIKSMALVKRKFPEAILLLVGSGPLQSVYLALGKKLDIDLRIIGPMPNSSLPAFYNAADVFVLPSLLEPAAMVLAEAQACGVPIVATNTGGTPERVKDQATGLLVPPVSSEELAYAIDSLLGDKSLRLRMSREATKYAAENFNWDNIAQKILQIYLQICREGHK